MIDDSSLVVDQLDETEDPAPAAAQGIADADIEERYLGSSFRVLYQTNNYFLTQIEDLIDKSKIINLRPEYQRRLRWTPQQKSLLIESLLLNVPIPPVFLYENDLARYEVMDGQQRLNAIYEYMRNDFALTGMENLKFLQRKRYNDLPPKLKRGLQRASVSAIVLLHESKGPGDDPSLVRRYVFQRLNTGGKALNAQEIRNSLYSGSFNDLIIDLSRNEVFCLSFGIPAYTEAQGDDPYENPARKANQLYKTMGDCTLVLRFFAFKEDEHIRGSVRSMLDQTMERNSTVTAEQLELMRAMFVNTINTVNAVFPGQPFTLPLDELGRRKSSVALYDAVMVAFYRRADHSARLIEHAQAIRDAVDQVSIAQPELMTGRANTAQSIKDRIAALIAAIDLVIQ